MKTCTWAPTTFAGTQVVAGRTKPGSPVGSQLNDIVRHYVERVESLGLSHLLIAQRWWGDARAIEGSSLDCLAMTSYIASHARHLELITAIHPGFFMPAAIAKYGATIDNLTGGRWSINVTSGWNMAEFDMYGADKLDHDERYVRSAEFIRVLKGAWAASPFTHEGKYYRVENLALEPRPTSQLTIYQGGQSEAAIRMATQYADWMFLNGGSPDKLRSVVDRIREAAAETGHMPKLGVYAIPLCRPTDAEADAEIDAMIQKIDPAILAERKQRLAGAEGMWRDADKLSMLDTNEGYATGLVGSPETIIGRVNELKEIGFDMLHLMLGDARFEEDVLPAINAI